MSSQDDNITTLLQMHKDLEDESAKRRAAYQQASQDLMNKSMQTLNEPVPQQQDGGGGGGKRGKANVGGPEGLGMARQPQEERKGPDESNLAGDSQLNDPRTGSDRDMGQESEAVDAAARQQRSDEMDKYPNPYLQHLSREGMIDAQHAPITRGIPDNMDAMNAGPTKASMSPEKAKMMAEMDAAKNNAIAHINGTTTSNPEHLKVLAELEAAKRNTINGIQNPGSVHVSPMQQGLQNASEQATQIQNMPPAPMPNIPQTNLPPPQPPGQQQYGVPDYYAFLKSMGYQ